MKVTEPEYNSKTKEWEVRIIELDHLVNLYSFDDEADADLFYSVQQTQLDQDYQRE